MNGELMNRLLHKAPWVKAIRNFFRGPRLPGNAGRTFRFHLAYAVLDAATGGILLAAMAVPPGALLVIGGLGVILSGVYSLWQATAERRERRPQTMTEFERQFLGEVPMGKSA
jgi:hypothetical protein